MKLASGWILKNFFHHHQHHADLDFWRFLALARLKWRIFRKIGREKDEDAEEEEEGRKEIGKRKRRSRVAAMRAVRTDQRQISL